jgi:signal transduction histidine kinase
MVDVSLWISPVRDETGHIVRSKIASPHLPSQARELELGEATAAGQFLAILAHELREPLAPVRNAAAICSSRDRRIWARRPVDMIGAPGAQMARLIDDCSASRALSAAPWSCAGRARHVDRVGGRPWMRCHDETRARDIGCASTRAERAAPAARRS